MGHFSVEIYALPGSTLSANQHRLFIRSGAAQQPLFHRGVYGSKWRVLPPVSKWNAVCARIFQEARLHSRSMVLVLP